MYEQCIEQLSKIYGKARLWKDAVTQARNQAKRAKQPTMMDKQQEEADALRQLNLFVRNNCYYCLGKDDEDPIRLSNFRMEPCSTSMTSATESACSGCSTPSGTAASSS